MTTENPLLAFEGPMDYAAITPEHVAPAIRQLIGQARSVLACVTDKACPVSWDTVVVPLDDATERLSRAWGAVSHLNSVADTDALRAAYNAMLPELTQFWMELGQNLALYRRYLDIAADTAFMQANPVRAHILRASIRDFRLSGADLPDDKKKQLMAISEREALISQKFSENLLDATNAWEMVLPDASRLKGVPADTLTQFAEDAKAHGKEGYRLSLHYPSYLPIMQYCEDRQLRHDIARAFGTRASEFDGGRYDNTAIIRELRTLREQEAGLLGMKNYGEVSLAPKMAESPEQVTEFLRTIARRAKPYGERDMQELRRFAAEHLGIGQLESWDLAFASEKLREARYAFSEEQVREYFPEDAVLHGLFALAEKLFGIHIAAGEAPVWNSQVRYWTITDAAGAPLAHFFTDLHARAHKHGGAWMDGERCRRRTARGLQLPVAYVNCNFAGPSGGRPALMRHDDVITLFHEFGHALQHMLTRVEELSASGINGVEWDAVELPSQFMENFAWQWDVISGLSSHVETGEKLPRELFDKMLAAKNFQSGMACLRQLEFALFDMEIHTQPSSGKPFEEILAGVRREVSVTVPPSWNRFPQSFSHIFAGGYAAGYYSYKWAEVLSADAFSAFEEEGVFNPATGRRWLDELLSRGGSRPAIDSFIAFRGRRPQIDALMRHSGMGEPLQ